MDKKQEARWNEIVEAHKYLQSVKGQVQFKHVDLDGLQMKKSKKEQAIEEEEEGKVLFEINCGVNPQEKIEPNMDIQPEEMNAEQREILESLQEPDLGWESLGDNYVIEYDEPEEVLNEKAIDESIQQVKGNQIRADDFGKIIEDEYNELIKNEPPQPETSKPDKKVHFDVDQEMTPQEIMEQKCMSWIPKKDHILIDEKVQRAEGGGLIIIRKLKKVQKSKKQYASEETGHKMDEEKIDMDKLDLQIEDDDNEPANLEQLEREY